MHLQTGKGENLDAIAPGMISVTDNPNPVTGGSLTYRTAAQFNNSWNWNIHYRAAASYITGSHNFKVGFNNAYLHHENTTYTDPAAPYSLHVRERGTDDDHVSDRAADDRRQRGLRLRHVRAGSLDDRPMDTRRAASATTRSRTATPQQAIAPTTLAPTLNHPVRPDRQPVVEGHHAEDGRSPTTCSVPAVRR